MPLEGGEWEGTCLRKKSAIRMWGRGSHTICVKESTVRRWEGEATHEKQKGRKSRGCNHGFLRVFSLEGLGLGFKLELNLEEVY